MPSPVQTFAKAQSPFFSSKFNTDHTFIDICKDSNYAYQKIYNGSGEMGRGSSTYSHDGLTKTRFTPPLEKKNDKIYERMVFRHWTVGCSGEEYLIKGK